MLLQFSSELHKEFWFGTIQFMDIVSLDGVRPFEETLRNRDQGDHRGKLIFPRCMNNQRDF